MHLARLLRSQRGKENELFSFARLEKLAISFFRIHSRIVAFIAQKVNDDGINTACPLPSLSGSFSSIPHRCKILFPLLDPLLLPPLKCGEGERNERSLSGEFHHKLIMSCRGDFAVYGPTWRDPKES